MEDFGKNVNVLWSIYVCKSSKYAIQIIYLDLDESSKYTLQIIYDGKSSN